MLDPTQFYIGLGFSIFTFILGYILGDIGVSGIKTDIQDVKTDISNIKDRVIGTGTPVVNPVGTTPVTISTITPTA